MNIMNLHCLELFYFVVRHGGVSGAARKMPYGIQPSSISKQLIQFEEQLGACLFQRRPFELTPAGEKLYAFIEPFFEAMPGVTDQLRKGVPEQVRLAASPIVLRDYLPPILRKLRQAFAELRFTLREGLQWQVTANVRLSRRSPRQAEKPTKSNRSPSTQIHVAFAYFA